MPQQSCSRCDAPVRGIVCEFCGVLTHPPADLAQEKAAWSEFAAIMQTSKKATRINMLQHGFLPDHVLVLIESGLHAMRLLDHTNTTDDLILAAAARLQAIVTKLRVLPETPESAEAIIEFERALAAFRRADRALNRWIVGVLAAVLLTGCGGLFWLFG